MNSARTVAGVRIENSFIPVEGVGETTERRLWEAGVTTWDEFEGDVVGDRVKADGPPSGPSDTTPPRTPARHVQTRTPGGQES